MAMAGALTATALGGCGQQPKPNISGDSPTPSPATSAATPLANSASPTPTPSAGSATPTPLPITKAAIPAGKSITEIPVPGPYMAWTIDDGTDGDVIAAYAQMAAQTGNRLVFFLNGNQPAWTKHADLLRPLVASGQVQLGNHTWSHADLRSLSAQGVRDQLQRNEDFIQNTYGVSAKPFYRPPFGYINSSVRSAAEAIGYNAPTMWYGSLSDSSNLTSDQISGFGDQWFGAGRVVIGHANHPGVIGAMPHLLDLLSQRGLRTVTLRDVFKTT